MRPPRPNTRCTDSRLSPPGCGPFQAAAARLRRPSPADDAPDRSWPPITSADGGARARFSRGRRPDVQTSPASASHSPGLTELISQRPSDPGRQAGPAWKLPYGLPVPPANCPSPLLLLLLFFSSSKYSSSPPQLRRLDLPRFSSFPHRSTHPLPPKTPTATATMSGPV